jgi:Icc-related predicted phosphoesterase
LHGDFFDLEGGDVLIVAGDCTSNDSTNAWKNYFDWFLCQKYRKKFMIAGNHDNYCKYWTNSSGFVEEIVKQGKEFFTYLCDSGEEFEGIKFWGSPWSLWFDGINPHCKAFTGTDEHIKSKFDRIPNDVDVLITHTPPYEILDEVFDHYIEEIMNFGSKSLLEAINRVKPKINIFGHIHECGGKTLSYAHDDSITECYNVAQMNRDYDIQKRPRRIII